MKILLDFQKGMRAVTLNSEFSLCGLIVAVSDSCPCLACIIIVAVSDSLHGQESETATIIIIINR